MSANRAAILIRKNVAQNIAYDSQPALKSLLGTPKEYDEATESFVPITGLNLYQVFKEHSSDLAPIQEGIFELATGDITSMYPDGAPEDIFAIVVMADRIPGNTPKEKQENREALKTILNSIMEAQGSSWTTNYLLLSEMVDYMIPINGEVNA